MDYKNLEHYDADRGAGTVADRTWLDSGSFWLKVTPVGFRNILNFIKEEYGDPPIYITENGVSERESMNLNDVHRIHYYDNYINQALKAYLLDGIDIRGYAAWTLMDNLEWATGFDDKFGFFYVNRSDPSLPRIPKKSVWHYATIINCNGFISPGEIPHECQIHEPDVDIPGTTPPSPPGEELLVSFLGLEVSAPDATLALNVLFSLSIIAAVAVVLLVYGLVKTSKKQKRPVEEHIDLEKKDKF
ncbi:lactase-phlorizin hydrolase-like [Sinocyclocheilus rhinocerous]|nr:PREDICTED: lactase-phlorizin hydrolase-like [Sinocyclocheilus rhinocerous]